MIELGTVIAVIRNQDDLVEAYRKIKELRELSNDWCDEVGGLTRGHTDKVLGRSRQKNLSPMTQALYSELFAVEFHMVVDLEAVKRMQGRWEQRDSSNVRMDAKRLSRSLIDIAKPIIARENGKAGGLARLTKMTETERQKIARKGGRARQRNRRKNIRERLKERKLALMQAQP